MSRDSPTGKPLKEYEGGLIGNTLWAWNCLIPALMPQCLRNGVRAWWLGKPRRCCWRCCWSAASSVGGGTAGGKQRTDSTHVLAHVRSLRQSRECVRDPPPHSTSRSPPPPRFPPH